MCTPVTCATSRMVAANSASFVRADPVAVGTSIVVDSYCKRLSFAHGHGEDRDMRLSVVTDEISRDLETALELACEWGVDGVELRHIGEGRWPAVPEPTAARVPELIRDHALPVAAISPGLFKIETPRPGDAEALARQHLTELLPRSIAPAQDLGADVIVCFSFLRGAAERPGPAPELVIDVLRDAARQVRDAGLTLAVEVEYGCWGDVAERTAEIVARVGDTALGINWDPANAYRSGEDRPFPDGYRAVRELVRHVHYKQASVLADGRRGWALDGVIDWPGQLAALAADDYQGWVSAEPHLRPKVRSTKTTIERMRRHIPA
ncbi:MAG: TIM barrel protein [Streptosporangiales bacterium]|nr:TIM barrel protein [Streptosporangiales bacterium]